MTGSQQPRIRVEPKRSTTYGPAAAALMEAYANELGVPRRGDDILSLFKSLFSLNTFVICLFRHLALCSFIHQHSGRNGNKKEPDKARTCKKVDYSVIEFSKIRFDICRSHSDNIHESHYKESEHYR